MSHSIVVTQTLPQLVDFPGAAWVRLAGAALLAAAVAALEAWLRVPVQPLIDGYAQAALARLASHFPSL
ncbi:MAG: hypothetical protein ABJD97_01855 [Betaproteobacteria bacterium]